MWYHSAAFVLGKRDGIGAWLVCLIVAAACFGPPILNTALDAPVATRHVAAGCQPTG